MSLSSIYQSFLSTANISALAEDASLNYITTLTTINNAPAIGKHIAVQQKMLKKKSEKILTCVEGKSAISVDVETTIEFLMGGGAYLPDLDDNFLTDRTVTIPVVR
jgi:hypothetical protein